MGGSRGRLLVAYVVAGAFAADCVAPAVVVPAADAPPALVAAPSASTRPLAAPSGTRELTLFVTSEMTNSISVLRGEASPALVASVPTAADPHNLGISPDGRWVATSDRMANLVSIVDTTTLKEVARVSVGHQPHDIQWDPDGSVLFVSQEHDTFIFRIEVGTWRTLAPLQVGVPQHDLAIWPGRPNELWLTATNTSASRALRVYHLDTNAIDLIDVDDVHDVFFTPDGSEVWTTSSGFIDKPSDRVVTYDPVTKKVTGEFHLGAGHYPFHSLKRGRDGVEFPPRTDVLFLTDRLAKALLVMDVKARTITKQIPVGAGPFHVTYGAEGRLYVTNMEDSTVTVVDAASLSVLATVRVPKMPHGIAALSR